MFYNGLILKIYKHIVMNTSYFQKNKTAIIAGVGVCCMGAVMLALYYHGGKGSDKEKETSSSSLSSPSRKYKVTDQLGLVHKVRELEYSGSVAVGDSTQKAKDSAIAKVNKDFAAVSNEVEKRVIVKESKEDDSVEVVRPLATMYGSIAAFAKNVVHNANKLTSTAKTIVGDALKSSEFMHKHRTDMTDWFSNHEVIISNTKGGDNLLNADSIRASGDEKYPMSLISCKHNGALSGDTPVLVASASDELIDVSLRVLMVVDAAHNTTIPQEGTRLLSVVLAKYPEAVAVCEIVAIENYKDKLSSATIKGAKKASFIQAEDIFKGKHPRTIALMGGRNFRRAKIDDNLSAFVSRMSANHINIQGGIYKFPEKTHAFPAKDGRYLLITSAIGNDFKLSDYASYYPDITHGTLILHQVCNIVDAHLAAVLMHHIAHATAKRNNNKLKKYPQPVSDLYILIAQQNAELVEQPLDTFVKDVAILAANVALQAVHELSTEYGDDELLQYLRELELSDEEQQTLITGIREELGKINIKIATVAEKPKPISYKPYHPQEEEQKLAKYRKNFVEEKMRLADHTQKLQSIVSLDMISHDDADIINEQIAEGSKNDDAEEIEVDRDRVVARVATHIAQEAYRSFQQVKLVQLGQKADTKLQANRKSYGDLSINELTTGVLNEEEFKKRMSKYEDNPAINAYAFRQATNGLIDNINKATTEDICSKLLNPIVKIDEQILKSEALKEKLEHVNKVRDAVLEVNEDLLSLNRENIAAGIVHELSNEESEESE